MTTRVCQRDEQRAAPRSRTATQDHETAGHRCLDRGHGRGCRRELVDRRLRGIDPREACDVAIEHDLAVRERDHARREPDHLPVVRNVRFVVDALEEASRHNAPSGLSSRHAFAFGAPP